MSNIEEKYIYEEEKPYIEMEHKFGCHNYHPLPVVLERGSGVYLYGVDGKRYYDFLSAYSAVSHGHCHPKICMAAVEQISKLTLTSRAFYNNQLGKAEKFLSELLKYDKTLFMNSGAEAVESAFKIARRWGYVVKKIPNDQAEIIMCTGNFHGRTIAIIGTSDDPERNTQFGPFCPGFSMVKYGDIKALEEKFNSNKNICAFLVEPIQGEAGILIPPPDYLKKCRELCTKHNVLLICDEIQTGLGRTGKWLCSEWFGVRPDIVLLGKSLSGGIMPISAVLCDDPIMNVIHPGEHGSTYGGNPLASVLVITAMTVMKEEKMLENSLKMGELLRNLLSKIQSPLIKEVRGMGLLSALELKKGGWLFSLISKKHGLLAKPTHESHIRLAPPLIITEEQIKEVASIIEVSLKELEQELEKKA